MSPPQEDSRLLSFAGEESSTCSTCVDPESRFINGQQGSYRSIAQNRQFLITFVLPGSVLHFVTARSPRTGGAVPQVSVGMRNPTG